MQCCVPFCDITSTTEKKEITFHGFPSDMYLRAAWLRALGKQDTHQPDPGVVCSLHFLDDDFYEAEGYVRQIRSDAIPSSVQICMMCLDTDSKLVPMSKHQLEEEYQLLTGQTLCETANLQQTLCVLCAQRLIHFRTFRHMSLRARSLIMDLVQKYKLITMQHTNMIKQATKQFKCNLVSTTLGADHCDLYIYQCDEDQQPELEDMIEDVATVVKDEEGWSSTSIADDMDVINEDENQADNLNNDNIVSNKDCSENSTSLGITPLFEDIEEGLYEITEVSTLDLLKRESASFTCTRCSEEFEQENAYYEHVSNHLQNTDNYSGCDSIQESKPRAAVSGDEHRQGMQRLNAGPPPSTEDSTQDLVAPLSGNTVQATGGACAIQKSKQILDINTEEMNSASSHSDTETHTDISRFTNCVVLLHDICNKPKKAVLEENQHLKSYTDQKSFSCDMCDYKCARKHDLVVHMRIHTREKPYSCDECDYKCTIKSSLTKHKLTHGGQKPYSCNICNFKCRHRTSLSRHMRLHTGIKPYSCEICDYKCARKQDLVVHMRIHTREKPYSCNICNFKCRHQTSLSRHMRLHTGIKPYSCEICDYKCIEKSSLNRHMKLHTGEKTYSCEVCDYKCIEKSRLNSHRKLHTDEKPYSCKICDYKCKQKRYLTNHMIIHSVKKPYSCNICNFKCKQKISLTRHKFTHTGEKPYSCEICGYKCIQKSNLTNHMIIHSVENPYSCNICNFKCKQKIFLTRHKLTHTGEKRYSCNICKFKCTHKGNLNRHMILHSGENPYSCDICDYKCIQKQQLTRHKLTHTGEKPYSCNICNFKCKQKIFLTRHKLTHIGEKRYSCNICKFKCTHKGNLNRHMILHTGENPYSCDICDYKCIQKHQLTRHKLTHIGDKLEPCEK